jgi:Septum formation
MRLCRRPLPPARRAWRLVPALAVSVVLTAGCGWFGGGGSSTTGSISVFDVKRGDCFTTPKAVKAELSKLSRVSCATQHTQEAYAVVTYHASAAGAAATSGAPDAYPGGDALDRFAKGVCAQRFTGYVGVDYLDSSLFFTYLLPSARSWEQDDDRNVLCFVTTTGGKLTSSVKGSRK